MKSDSSEEFEDAVDTLGPLPSTPIRPNDFGTVTPRMPSTSANQNLATPFSKMEVNPQSNRRNRLATLRNRMQSEFGGGGMLTGMDEDASQSDRTSLASWGRTFLMERSNDSSVIAVCPADSLSTKAMPVTNSLFDRTGNAGFGLSSDNSAKINNNLKFNGTTRTTMNIGPQDQGINQNIVFSPSSPPPLLPPPPLPERPAGLGGSPLVPPPLPPRKSVTSPPTTTSGCSSSNMTTSSVGNSSVNNSGSVVQEELKTQNIFFNNASSLEESAKSSGSSTPSNVLDSYGKKRGHAKTNSLDRGLTLAKSMKSGPFPPPQATAKSSSLNRGCSPNEMLIIGGALCEEDQEAQNVIEQITDSILSNCDVDDGNLDFEKEKPIYPSKTVNSELITVGEESSTTSTPTKPGNLENQKVESAGQKKIQNNSNRRYENLFPIQQNEEELDSKLEKTFEKTVEIKNLAVSDSIDPITRDVARRMSKDQQGTNCPESESESQVNLQSGLEHAKNIVKNYTTIAGGFFKGAFTKAKKSITSNNPPKALSTKDEDEDLGSMSDECTASVSENINVQQNSNFQKTPEQEIICRPKNHKKGPFDFDQLRVVQELNNEHTGAVWVVKFSVCGKLLATAGQDNIVRVWVLKNHLNHFSKVRERLNQQTNRVGTTGNSGLNDDLQFSMQNFEDAVRAAEEKKSTETDSNNSPRKSPDSNVSPQNGSSNQILMAPKPYCTYRGHTADILDLSWSRNYFILSCGMDRTVRLWHLARSECLCCFQHMDFVTCIAFMPKDDRYFISGSMDGKIRLWHIPDKKVALWNEVEQVKFITAITFVRNGKFVVVGTYNGRCFFYTTDQLKYHTVIDVRSSQGKNSRGHKITSLAVHGDKLLVTSNDSRIRMYDLRDMDLTCKFKGAQIEQSQIRASFSPDGKHILCGSEDNYIYIWRSQDFSPSLSVRKDRNPMWERAKVHNSVVTAAVFAPKPQLFLALIEDQQRSMSVTGSTSVVTSSEAVNERVLKRMDSDVVSSHGALPLHIPSIADTVNVGGSSISTTATISQKDRQLQGDIIVSADLSGCIKIMANPSRIKTGSSHFFATDYN